MRAKLYLKERLLYINDIETLSYKHGFLIYRCKEDIRKCKIGNLMNCINAYERLIRKEPRCAAKVDDDNILISFKGRILNYCISSNTTTVDHIFSKGMNNPLDFLCVEDPMTFEKAIYYGEYIWNYDKGPVDIYIRKDSKWRIVFSFPEKTIMHIHNIIFDRFRNGFIILTGDEDSESGIWFADCDFKSVKPILSGSQQYRACVAFPTEKGIYYATDTPLENNYIYFIELGHNLKVLEHKKIFNMPGPCIYGCRKNQYMFFSTSVEPDSSLNKWRYRITYKLGLGVKDRYSHIIRGDEKGEFEDLFQFRKDNFPMWLFQFGNILFPQNETNELFAVLQSTSLGHGVTLKIS